MRKLIFLLLVSINFIMHASDTYPAKGVQDVDGFSDDKITKLIQESGKSLIAIQVSTFAKN